MPTRVSPLTVLVALLAVGCNSGPAAAPGSEIAKPAGGAPTGKVEVVAFKGGYDIDFYAKSAEEFSKENSGLEVSVTGNPRVWETLRPRMVGGNPPDLMFPGWGMDHWALVQEGQLEELDAALDEAGPDGKTWRSTFDPNLLKLCQKDGKTYMLPLYVMVYGWWYDPAVFERNGWQPPKDWPALMSLCDKIKAKGMAPITFQGQYPYYMIEGMLLPWACSIGGRDAIDAAQNLEPGAWKSPAMLQAAQLIAELRDKGCFQQGAVGMTHTESQTQFLNGHAAMVPCGSWLESEMKDNIPKGAGIAFMMPPAVPGGKGDPSSLLIGIEPWMVPVGAKNKAGAIAYFKYMTSLPKAKQFVEEKGTLMSIVGSDEAKMPETLKAPAAALKSSKNVWAVQYRMWYPAMQKEIEGAMTALLNKELTPQQFVDRCEAAAETTRKDSSIAKYKL